MIPSNFISKVQSTLPFVQKWIDDTLDDYKSQATSIIDLKFPRLSQIYPSALLAKAKVVVVAGKVPLPPLSSIGFSELAEFEAMSTAGVTYKDTFFLIEAAQSESAHFHELVHVVQWERLGADNFWMAYGAGLMQSGYLNSPLEQMAYSLQNDFDRGMLTAHITELISQKTDAIWKGVAPLFGKS
jgi:hypothetical protein